jgi:hypothetical protein
MVAHAQSDEILMIDNDTARGSLARIALTATVDRIEARPLTLAGFATDIVLRDATDRSGIRFPDGIRLGQTGRLRALDLMQGDQIALSAQLDAYAEGAGRIASGITDPAAFLLTCPESQRALVIFRLIRPSGVRRA